MEIRTIFGFLVALLVLSSTVYAGSIRDLQHWDRNSDKGNYMAELYRQYMTRMFRLMLIL